MGGKRAKGVRARMAVLGPLTLSQVAKDLGTNFKDFKSPLGLHGQCCVKGNTIDVLSMFANSPGSGQCRRFIKELKALYDEVHVLSVWNKELQAALGRYGFTQHTRVDPVDGEEIDCWTWNKITNNQGTTK